MSPWKQVTPRELLASCRSAKDVIEEERNSLINALKHYNIEELLELEQRAKKSLLLLVQEAISDLLRKYPDCP